MQPSAPRWAGKAKCERGIRRKYKNQYTNTVESRTRTSPSRKRPNFAVSEVRKMGKSLEELFWGVGTERRFLNGEIDPEGTLKGEGGVIPVSSIKNFLRAIISITCL